MSSHTPKMSMAESHGRDPRKYIVVLGAAIRPDGTPSGSLIRRVASSWDVAKTIPDAPVIVTGGQGRFGHPEAHVMKELLIGHGCGEGRILIDDQARDTFDSIVNCVRLIRSKEGRQNVLVIVCSSAYHVLRCRILFGLCGIKTRSARPPDDRKHLGTAKWLYYWVRDLVALPYDACLMVAYRRKISS